MGGKISCCEPNDAESKKNHNYERHLYALHIGNKFLDELDEKIRQEMTEDALGKVHVVTESEQKLEEHNFVMHGRRKSQNDLS